MLCESGIILSCLERATIIFNVFTQCFYLDETRKRRQQTNCVYKILKEKEIITFVDKATLLGLVLTINFGQIEKIYLQFLR